MASWQLFQSLTRHCHSTITRRTLLAFRNLSLELRADRIIVVTPCLYVHVTFSVAYQLYQKRSKWLPATNARRTHQCSSLFFHPCSHHHPFPSIKDLPTRRKLLQSLLRLPNFLDLIVLQRRLAFARPWQFRMPLIGSMGSTKMMVGMGFLGGDSCWTVDGQNDPFRRRYSTVAETVPFWDCGSQEEPMIVEMMITACIPAIRTFNENCLEQCWTDRT